MNSHVSILQCQQPSAHGWTHFMCPCPHRIMLKQIPGDTLYPHIFQHVRNTTFLLLIYVNVIHRKLSGRIHAETGSSVRGPRI